MLQFFYFMAHYEFIFSGLQSEQSDILIARLNELNFEGFEEDNGLLKAYIKPENLDIILFNNIIEQNSLIYSKSIINETCWNAKWESDFEPVSVILPGMESPFAYVRAGFHIPNPAAMHDILITPKMSFGTGHHATTYLMIEQMSRLDFKGKTVIDFGTGTGVLAVLAEKMGAASVIGIDNDDWSINNARENVVANQCKAISIVQASTIDLADKAAILLANINLPVITGNINEIKNCCKIGADILFSGILADDEAIIVKVLQDNGIRIQQVHNRNNWLAIKATI